MRCARSRGRPEHPDETAVGAPEPGAAGDRRGDEAAVGARRGSEAWTAAGDRARSPVPSGRLAGRAGDDDVAVPRHRREPAAARRERERVDPAGVDRADLLARRELPDADDPVAVGERDEPPVGAERGGGANVVEEAAARARVAEARAASRLRRPLRVCQILRVPGRAERDRRGRPPG